MHRHTKGDMNKLWRMSILLLWTLWTRTQTATSDNWLPAPGLGSAAKCQASVTDKQDMWRQLNDAKIEGNSVTLTSNNSSMTYLSFPENEEPRNPQPRA